MATIQLFFSLQRTDGSLTGTDPDNWVGDQDTGSPGRPISSGLQVSDEPGHCRERTDPLRELPAAFFLQNVLQLWQQRSVILRVDSLALCKVIIEEHAFLNPKKFEARTFPADFCTRNFFGAGLAAMPPFH